MVYVPAEPVGVTVEVVPSPQSMVAVKELPGAWLPGSLAVATVPLNDWRAAVAIAPTPVLPRLESFTAAVPVAGAAVLPATPALGVATAAVAPAAAGAG